MEDRYDNILWRLFQNVCFSYAATCWQIFQSRPDGNAVWWCRPTKICSYNPMWCKVVRVLSVCMPKLLPNSQSIVCLLPWLHGTLLVNGWNLVFGVCLSGNQGTAATPRSRLGFEIFHYKLVYMPMLYINIFNKQQHRNCCRWTRFALYSSPTLSPF